MQLWYKAVKVLTPEMKLEWCAFVASSGLSHLGSLCSLDHHWCPPVFIDTEEEDWEHNVHEDYHLNYYLDLDYLLARTASISNVTILAALRRPGADCRLCCSNCAFEFKGYDLVEPRTGISALNAWSRFRRAFAQQDVSTEGLVQDYERASEIQNLLRVCYPAESHAFTELWGVWKMLPTKLR